MSATIATRTITVHSPQGRNGFSFEFTGSTWGELKRVVAGHGYNIDSMKAVESVTRHTLENPAGILPVGDFRLHLYPTKTKSGGMSRREIYDEIKALGDDAKAYFNEGQNFTRKTSEELEGLLSSYGKKGSKKKSVTTATPKKAVKAAKEEPAKAKKAGKIKGEKISKIVASVATSKGKSKVIDGPEPLDVEVQSDRIIEDASSSLSFIEGHRNQRKVATAIAELDGALGEAPVELSPEEEHRQLREGLSHLQ